MREQKLRTFRSLSDIMPGLARAALKDDGSVKVRLLTQWPSIVGNDIAKKCTPHDVKFRRGEKPDATLHLEVQGGYAQEVQMLEPVILEKIAVYFGYKAVARLKLRQV